MRINEVLWRQAYTENMYSPNVIPYTCFRQILQHWPCCFQNKHLIACRDLDKAKFYTLRAQESKLALSRRALLISSFITTLARKQFHNAYVTPLQSSMNHSFLKQITTADHIWIPDFSFSNQLTHLVFHLPTGMRSNI